MGRNCEVKKGRNGRNQEWNVSARKKLRKKLVNWKELNWMKSRKAYERNWVYIYSYLNPFKYQIAFPFDYFIPIFVLII